MDKQKLMSLSPATVSLLVGLGGAILYALNDLLQSGATLTAPVIVQAVMAAVVSFLLSYGIGMYHLYQPAPGASSQQPAADKQPDNEANQNN
jgi:hypothetical protein